MRSVHRHSVQLVVVAVTALLAAGPSFADDTHGKKAKPGKDDALPTVDVDVRFVEPQGIVARNYYVTQIKGGNCPPGLDKKDNGCLPPGQAKKWRIGAPLPRDVVFHELPPPLLAKLGPPPPGYRYARVANDVLLLALGSGMVVDAITDLGRM